MLKSYRNIVMKGIAPSNQAILYAAILGLFLFIVGYSIMQNKDQEYPKLS